MSELTSAPRQERRAPRRRFVWHHFAAKFREHYGEDCPFDGLGYRWPAGTKPLETGDWLPSARENRLALKRLHDLGSFEEIRARIDRMFAHEAHRRAGVTLTRVANWWSVLDSSKHLASRTGRLRVGA